MLPDSNDKLTIRYSYGFARNDRDRGVEIPIGTGCCGQAWLQGDTMMADLTQVGGMPNHWGLPREEIAKIRPTLRSILSVPVRSGEDYRVVAILNIDSDNDVKNIGFEIKAVQDLVYSFATVIGTVMDEALIA